MPLRGGSSTAGIIFEIVASSVIAVGVAMLSVFWSLADPRADIKALRAEFTNYLTIREHNEFRERVHQDRLRLEQQNERQVGREEFLGWARAHEDRDREVVSSLRREIDGLQKQVDHLDKMIDSDRAARH